MELTAAQIYNADETALFWKSFEVSTLVSQEEKSAPGRKKAKERITFMPCSNADGSNKLRLMVLGKSKNPRPFKNISLPVYYRSSKKGWMNKNLFKEWFQNEFVVSVRAFSEQNNIRPTALLVLDNAPSHYEGNELESDDGLIKVIYLPPNTTALLQPMDQNVIYCIKTKYRIQLVKELLASENVDQGIKLINIKDTVFLLHSSWSDISASLIKNSWSKLHNFNDNLEILENEYLIHLTDKLNQLNMVQNITTVISTEDVTQFLNDPNEQVQYAQYSDKEIVDLFNRSGTSDWEEQESEILENENDSENDFNTTLNATLLVNRPNNCITKRTALSNIDNLICYAEQQHYNLEKILLLRDLRSNILDDLNQI